MIVFSAINSSASDNNYKAQRLSTVERQGKSGKDLAAQVYWPKVSSKAVTKVIGSSVDAITNKINNEVVADHCPAGIKCMGGLMNSALNKVKNVLASREGSGGIGYKSVSETKQQKIKFKQHGSFDEQVNKIKKEKLKLKLDDMVLELEQEEVKQDGNGRGKFNKINKAIMKLKPNDSIFKLLEKEDKRDGSDDEQMNNVKNQDDSEITKFDDDDIIKIASQNLKQNQIGNAEYEPRTKGVKYFVLGGNKIVAVR